MFLKFKEVVDLIRFIDGGEYIESGRMYKEVAHEEGHCDIPADDCTRNERTELSILSFPLLRTWSLASRSSLLRRFGVLNSSDKRVMI